MSYALIEIDTGNMVGFYSTERAALEDVLDSINRYGVESIETLGLGFNDPTGPVRRIAAGTELAQRALAMSAPVRSRLRVVREGRSSAPAAKVTSSSAPSKAAPKTSRSAPAVTSTSDGRAERATSRPQPNPPPQERPKT